MSFNSQAPWPSIVLHADMDAFFAAVEQNDNADLRGKPVVIGGKGPRSVVSTASYEARKYGVGSAMPMVTALRRCPHAIVVPPNMARYKEVSNLVMAVFSDFSPVVEQLSVDEAFIDMTGATKLFGTPLQMGEAIKKAVFDATDGLTISVGASVNKFVAKVASDYQKPDGLTVVPPGEVLNFLWPLSIKRLWGVGPIFQKKLLELGLRTIGDVAGAPEDFLLERFGSQGVHISRLSRGIDDRAVEKRGQAKSVGSENTMAKDIKGIEDIEKHIRRSSDITGRGLRSKGLFAGGVRVKLRCGDFRLMTKQATLPVLSNSTKTIFNTAMKLLKQLYHNEPVRLVGVSAFDLSDQTKQVQGELFGDRAEQRNKKLDQALDAVRARFGNNAVVAADDQEKKEDKPNGH